MASPTRRHQFTIAFDVEPDPRACDEPEWAADAAHGALSRESGLVAISSDVTEIALARQP